MFRKAERKKAKLRLGISGASGTGKTWSALEIAKGLGGKIAMIDTEAGRGELYGSDFDYDVLRLDAPYSPERYIQSIKAAEAAGYDVLIIDSLSHAWVGEGGVLSIVERAGGNSFTSGWKTATPKQNALVDAIITSKIHIIVTVRSKTEWGSEINDKGKFAPKKIGTAPVQRDGLEYEFTVFMDMSQEHIAHVTKDNTKLYDQEYIKPTQEMGNNLIEWLNSGKSPEETIVEDIQAIHNNFSATNTTEELSNKFFSALKQYPHLKEQIIVEKDKRKHELDEEQFPDVMPNKSPTLNTSMGVN